MRFSEQMRQFKFVVKPSSKATIIAIALAVIIALAALLVLRSMTLEAQARMDQARTQAQQLEQENLALEEKIDNLGTLEGIKDIAKEELGLVDPDTVIIKPAN